jgi:hypothetical protein
VSFKLFGCELPEDGDEPHQVAARKGETDIGKIVNVHMLELRNCNNSECIE